MTWTNLELQRKRVKYLARYFGDGSVRYGVEEYNKFRLIVKGRLLHSGIIYLSDGGFEIIGIEPLDNESTMIFLSCYDIEKCKGIYSISKKFGTQDFDKLMHSYYHEQYLEAIKK